MSSRKFEQLAAERPEFAEALRAVRAFLDKKRDDDAVITKEILAALLNAPQDLIGPTLDELAAMGGLRAWDALECSQCKNVIEHHDDYCSQCLEPNRDNLPIVRYVISPERVIAANPTVATSSATNSLMTWLHLSDIHCGHPDASHSSDQQLVLMKLLEDLSELQRDKSNPSPEYIIITGDIAFSGNLLAATEYGHAEEFLGKLGKLLRIERRNIYLVPGNHDIRRCYNNNDARRLIEALRSGNEDLDKVVQAESDKRHILSRQEAYLDFAKNYAPYCLKSEWLDSPQMWHHTLSIDGLDVRFIGLNTALLAHDDNDKGKLRIGMSAISQALADRSAGSCEITVVLSHHPLSGGWLANETDCMQWIRSVAQIHLSGHIHDGQSWQMISGDGRALININAGAVHGDKVPQGTPARHGYNIASLSRLLDSEFELRIWYRTWSDKRKAFMPDLEVCSDKSGFASHRIHLPSRPSGAK